MGRKTERVFKKVSNIKEYMDVLKSHGDKVLFRYPVGTQYESITYAAFHEQVMNTAAGLAALGLAVGLLAGRNPPRMGCSGLACVGGTRCDGCPHAGKESR